MPGNATESGFWKKLNFIKECRRSEVSIWQCPPFLFIVMGFVNILAMVSSYLLASRYGGDLFVATSIVFFVSAFILIVGHLIISGFNKVVEANNMKSEFISIISHQLRSPLSIFKWTMDVLIKESKEAGGKTIADEETYLNILKENTERMISLVNLLLETNRVDSKKMVLNRIPISLDKITKEQVDSVLWYAQAYNVAIDFNRLPDPPMVTGDLERVKMVIQNLIDNAIRYSRGKGQVKILMKNEEKFLKWEVHDDGVGIPAAGQKFIFQKFYRSNNAVRHQTQGSGIGLYIAKAIIQELGGKIGFVSEENKGSVFWFTLPITRNVK